MRSLDIIRNLRRVLHRFLDRFLHEPPWIPRDGWWSNRWIMQPSGPVFSIAQAAGSGAERCYAPQWGNRLMRAVRAHRIFRLQYLPPTAIRRLPAQSPGICMIVVGHPSYVRKKLGNRFRCYHKISEGENWAKTTGTTDWDLVRGGGNGIRDQRFQVSPWPSQIRGLSAASAVLPFYTLGIRGPYGVMMS